MARFVAAGPTNKNHIATHDFTPFKTLPGNAVPVSKKIYKPSIKGEELTSEFVQELDSLLPIIEFQDLVLPGEVFLLIGEHLDVPSIVKLASTCKQFFELFQNEYYWRNLFVQRLPHLLEDKVEIKNIEELGWKQTLILKAKVNYRIGLLKDAKFNQKDFTTHCYQHDMHLLAAPGQPSVPNLPMVLGPGLYPVIVWPFGRRNEYSIWRSWGRPIPSEQ